MAIYKHTLGQNLEAAKRSIERIHADPWCERASGTERGTDVALIRLFLQRLEDTGVLENHLDDR